MDTETSKSLVNIGELAKPVDTFIKKVSDAIGIIYEPTHVRRMAKAQVDAEKTKALGRIELTDLQTRGLQRMITQQARIQENLENITQKALDELKDDAEPEKLDGDWVALFYEECQHVSNPEIQSLWAKILAGEANQSGTYSARTIKVLGSIGKTDAELFTQLCGFAWMIGEVCPLIFDLGDSLYNDAGINFTTLTDLAALGLISVDGFGVSKSVPQGPVGVVYFGTIVMLSSSDQPMEISIGHVTLTKAGKELAPICGAIPKDGFIEYVVRRWATPRFHEKPLSAFSEWPRRITPGS